MTLEGAKAWAADINRLRKLEKARHFKSGFAYESGWRALRYIWRIWYLAAKYRIWRYPGPTVTE